MRRLILAESGVTYPITQLCLLNSIANKHRTASPCVAAGRLLTVRTVIRRSYVPWWWGCTEPVSPRPPRLHRISTLGSAVVAVLLAGQLRLQGLGNERPSLRLYPLSNVWPCLPSFADLCRLVGVDQRNVFHRRLPLLWPVPCRASPMTFKRGRIRQRPGKAGARSPTWMKSAWRKA